MTDKKRSGGPEIPVQDRVPHVDDTLPKDEAALQSLLVQLQERQDNVAKELKMWRDIGKLIGNVNPTIALNIVETWKQKLELLEKIIESVRNVK